MGKQWWEYSSQRGPWAAFGFGQGARFFEAGELRLAILSLLDEGPKHGYQLMKEMQELSGGLYRASAGSVYPTLQQLKGEGLIESTMKDGRRVYRPTAAGKKELNSDPDGVRRIWDRAERWEDWGQCMGPETLAVVGSLGAIVKATMRAARWAGGRADREEKVRGIIQRTCRELDSLSGR
jgi:DNA-binding PadR family transcriptional regulator